jgi:hypothetical protein
LTQPAKSSNCSTVSHASGASLIVRPSPRPLEAPLTAQLRLSRAEADPTCEHHRKSSRRSCTGARNEPLGGRASASKFKLVYIRSDRINRFQTRVGLGGERESNVYNKKRNWAA